MNRNYDFQDPFSSSFNYMKLRYQEYGDFLESLNFLNPYDKVSLYINIETVLKHLTMIQDIERKLFTYRDFESLFISNFLNLAAHYKRFFISNNLPVKIYLYYTDFNSEEFHEQEHIEDYRSYYLNKYNENPKFAYMTDSLKKKIFPDLKTYTSFIPDVYLISGKNIEGSLIPLIISKTQPDRKHIVLTSELFDTQYKFIENFHLSLISRTQQYGAIHSSMEFILHRLCKKDKDNEIIKKYADMYSNPPFYCTLLSCIGDKDRSIPPIQNIGPSTLEEMLIRGIIGNIITKQTNSPEIIKDIFHDIDDQEDYVDAYYCTCINSMYKSLTETEIKQVLDQITDQSDINTLNKINNTVFANHPLMLDNLLM